MPGFFFHFVKSADCEGDSSSSCKTTPAHQKLTFYLSGSLAALFTLFVETEASKAATLLSPRLVLRLVCRGTGL